ncbi:Acetylxylan esterase precursor [Botrimarina colliarenosi]|uniref:Acetylxylan esterase n=1 Tax=Botrimarina colliarenosi TaxID=2528001 RepID=A0A5C6ALD3_9BACT|nr:GDSL-type esterase/lipase family protein [Botrimarina colliarenosi]TWU00288.1 Acetylxylan esterase precursor [Botrimarina colliarenosi]
MEPKPSEPLRVACVGASVTFGRGLPNRRVQCYPAVLQRLADERFGAGGWLVRNFGYSGATVSRGSNEPYWQTPSFTAATRFEPQLVLMMLGTNDAQFANEAARQTLAADLVDLVEHFRQFGAEVLVADPPPAFPPVAEIDFDALRDEVRPTIRRVVGEIGAPLVDFLTPLADTAADFPDGLHPTAPVAERIAQIAFEALLERLPAG